MPAKGTWKSNSLWPAIKEILDSGKDLIVFDLETTGLSAAKERIIEIAAIKYRVEKTDTGRYDMVETDVYHQYINPERKLDDAIINLTGITDEQLASQPTEAECIDSIQAFFDGCIISGYNIDSFDVKFMNELYGRFGRFFRPGDTIDCIKMARNRLLKDTDVENFKLATVGAHFGISFEAHSAIEDTRTTGKLIQIFLHEYADEETTGRTQAEGTLRGHVNSVSFWEGFKGYSRIYVNMDIGTVYYDLRSAVWGGKDIDTAELDMEWLESEAFRIANCSNETEFSKFKGNVKNMAPVYSA